MFRIFRAIRARLLRQGKVTGYIAYAVGEIFLVVVGILIALQVSNWNEQRKIRASEQKILESIRGSLLIDSMQYFTMRNRVEVYNHSIQTLLSKPPFHDTLTNDFVNSLNGVIVNSRTSAFEQLRSLGLERIQNTTLRDSLVRHYDEYVKIGTMRMESNVEFFVNNFQYPFYEKHLLFSAADTDFNAISYLPKDYNTLIDNPEFRSILVEKWLFNQQTSDDILTKLQRKTRVLLGQIEEELEK
ncbi:MAG: hypothetical protein GC205_11555 [Bacteroidetes bacterium]|nr:hypothetical protein [Bacteroidota bacterium]